MGCVEIAPTPKESSTMGVHIGVLNVPMMNILGWGQLKSTLNANFKNSQLI